MNYVIPVFKMIQYGEKLPTGYHNVNCYMVFEVKMSGLLQKASMVSGGNITDPTTTMNYTSVLLRETMRVALNLVV